MKAARTVSSRPMMRLFVVTFARLPKCGDVAKCRQPVPKRRIAHEHGVLQVELRLEGLEHARALEVHPHRDDAQAAGGVAPLEDLEPRSRCDAGEAPGGHKLHHHHPAPPSCHVQVPAIDVLQAGEDGEDGVSARAWGSAGTPCEQEDEGNSQTRGPPSAEAGAS